jgi:hypothetical protein
MLKTLVKILKNFNKNGLIKLVHILAKKNFRFWEKHLSLHLTPAHYYSPIPITNELDSNVFAKVYDCVGIKMNTEEQLSHIRESNSKYQSEYKPQPNGGLSLVDAFVLHSMIREKKPKVMIEIGAGDTTKISLQSLKVNEHEGYPYTFYSIEPYPRDELRTIHDENFKLIPKKLQAVEIDLLSTADILFIDSSHVSKIGSDVNYEILEIVPKLKVGALVHWHDIVIPTNYWKDWIDDGNMFWNESYMVHSFMLFNESFKIVCASRYLQLKCFNDLKVIFPYLENNHRLTSFWIERIK